MRLTTREARRKLPARDRPYHQELRRGLWLGYRRGATGGTWSIREHRDGGFVKRRLGRADDDVPSDGATVLTYSEAVTQALGAERPTITRPGKLTVAKAAEDYFATRRSITTHDRFTWSTFIEPDLGAKTVAELTTHELERWLADQVLATSDKDKLRAARATANRRWTVVRAILNSSYRKNPAQVPSADAWRRVQPYQNVDQPRLRVLTTAEARRLLNALPPGMRALARAALYSGCRLGELQALTVADVTDNELHIRHSKTGRSRALPLSAEGAAFFAEVTVGKAGEQLVFEPVSRIAVSRTMRAACTVAKISPAATFHDLRRSFGSLLLNSGASADVVQELLGHADVRMTRRVYAHLLQKTLRKAVDKHLPDFGREGTNVVPLKRRSRGAAT